ncbi:MAG: sigma-70 family RNA polymerase sigma factor [Desulfobacteraceae bacterium]|nr:MAG: sigma-70 family RNA polymerase sigma factor [Desulfobacteraceae bacterium]
MSDSKIAFHEDYEYANLLLSGEAGAWDKFYKEFRKKLESYINKKYPDVFSSIAIEEILDGVGRRLIENDFKTIREYRGQCSFSTYLTRATEWEVKDWLRKHSNELLNEPIDAVGEDSIKDTDHAQETEQNASFFSKPEEIPEPVRRLSDDLRFSFLLRYYDYFGFPLDDVRLLAKKRGITIRLITEKIVEYFDPARQDILRPKREKYLSFQEKLQRLTCKIHKLNVEDHRLSDSGNDELTRTDRLQDVRAKRAELEKRKETLLEDGSGYIVTTPYEVIADILGEENITTIRSRVFNAKRVLIERISTKNSYS